MVRLYKQYIIKLNHAHIIVQSVDEGLTYRYARDDSPLNTPLCSSVISLLVKYLQRQFEAMLSSHVHLNQERIKDKKDGFTFSIQLVHEEKYNACMHAQRACLIHRPTFKRKH
jgi:hypothetical protein